MDSMLALLLITLLAPFVGALFAGLTRGRVSQFIAVIASMLALVTAAAAILAIYFAGPLGKYPYLLPTPALPWISNAPLFGLSIDRLGAVMLGAVVLVGFLMVLYSTEYIARRRDDDPAYDGARSYFFWMLLFLASLIGVALSPNLLQMLIFWEFNSLCSWALISNSPKDKALRAGFKALVVTYIGGMAFMVALLLIFVGAKSFNFEAIGLLSPAMKFTAIVLLLVAAWAKCAQIPFHTWLPEALTSPTPIASYLPAAALVKPGVYLIARLMISGFNIPTGIADLMALMAFLTMFMAVLAFFRQDDLYRLLGYLTIAHLGYIFVGLALGIYGSREGYQGAVLYLLCDGAAKATLLMSIGSIAYATGTRKINQLQGLSGKLWLEGIAYLVGALAATGVPPFAGFWPKFMIFTGTLNPNVPGGPVLLALLAAESVVSFGWFLWLGQKIFLGKPSEIAAAAGDPPPGMAFALIAGMALCLLLPLVGIPLVSGLMP